MNNNGTNHRRNPRNTAQSAAKRNKRIGMFIFWVIIIGVIVAVSAEILGSSGEANTDSGAGPASTESEVPWDYRIEQAKVGDLIGGDVTISPDNQLMPNDNNYATGDNIWVLSYMSADMKTNSDGKNEVTLSSWKPIKTFKDEAAAKEDMDKLKIELQTEVDLVGVYKTEYKGQNRFFAVLTMPSGHDIKQPIPEERYNAMKNKEKVKIVMEELHDFSDYDVAMSKFRGWVN